MKFKSYSKRPGGKRTPQPDDEDQMSKENGENGDGQDHPPFLPPHHSQEQYHQQKSAKGEPQEIEGQSISKETAQDQHDPSPRHPAENRLLAGSGFRSRQALQQKAYGHQAQQPRHPERDETGPRIPDTLEPETIREDAGGATEDGQKEAGIKINLFQRIASVQKVYFFPSPSFLIMSPAFAFSTGRNFTSSSRDKCFSEYTTFFLAKSLKAGFWVAL